MNSEIQSKPSRWWKFIVQCDNPEDIGAELLARGAAGVHLIDNSSLECFICGNAAFMSSFSKSIEDIGASIKHSEEVKQQNWSLSCPELWEIRSIGNIEVIPTDGTVTKLEPCLNAKSTPLYLIPGTGFGTGHHASTAMVLELLQSNEVRDLKPERVLDVGTGSGILAIAAAKLYQASVLATDIDPLALNNAADNVALNSCQNLLRLSLEPIEKITGSFNLILANIYAEVLCALRPSIEGLLAANGIALMSGIMVSLADNLEQAFLANDWKVLRRIEREGWASFLMTRVNAIRSPQ